MSKRFLGRAFLYALLASALLSASYLSIGLTAELLPPGFRPLPVGVHALRGGNVVIKPGESLTNATIVIRDGIISAVGANVAIPEDARIWEMKGHTIYAGFIESYWQPGATNSPVTTSDTEPAGQGNNLRAGVQFFGAPNAQTDMGNVGPGSQIAKIASERRTAKDYSPNEKALTPMRELGFTAAVVSPAAGIIRGTSALVSLAEENPNELILAPDVFQHISFETHQPDERAFPGSLMGVIAAIRQSFFDAQHYQLDHEDYKKNPGGRRIPEFNPANEALLPVIDKKMRVMAEPGSVLMEHRAAQLASELGFDFSLVSCGQEWRRPDLIKATGVTFIVPLDFPELPKLPNASDWEQVELDQLRRWDWAPENPALLRQQGIEIALTTYGLSDRKKFRPNLKLALARGLSETDALAALTTVPARLCGLQSRLGMIEPTKLANLTVVSGESYFDPESKVTAVWIDGKFYPSAPEEPKPGKAEEMKPAKPVSPEEGAPTRKKPATESPPKETPVKADAAADPSKKASEEPKKEKTKEQLLELQKKRIARSPMEGRGPLASPPSLLIRNATIWTCGEAGVITNGSLLVSHGKIQSVGSFKVELDANTQVIDGTGLHLTPGLIDCHSHTAILGSVNENTLPSTAMVRIQDVINSESEHIYEQLAGGLTTANLLHGSANPIGGQNCVVKFRFGAGPDGLIFEEAPHGIKFALGENVKQSNWGEKYTTRFPQTRMGVHSFIENRFTAAREYLEARRAQQASGGVPPRRDLELEALGEILEGQRWIHCHSYRQDEILMLIRLMERFKVKIGTFQHVLEGYKVADEIAQSGAGASTFSDWWAYKFEVYDAIPYNASLMRERGVTVSINSDSSEVARHLYLEAAKCVKYG